jgi:hypothetical protein
MYKYIGLGAVVLIGLMVLGSVVGIYNTAVNHEAGINASYKDNQQILATYGNKIKEAAGVTEMYTEDTVKVTTAAIEGRYGEDGSKATWQWLKEQNPVLNVVVYWKVQQLIEAGRNEFKSGQTILLDKCRIYESYRKYLFTGFVLRMLGFPSDAVLLDKMCKPVTSEYADESYEKGKSEPIQLRK